MTADTISKPGAWDNIKTIRDLAKSRFYICSVLALFGLYLMASKINLPFSLTGATNEINIVGGLLFLWFMAVVLSGCGKLSKIAGFLAILAGILFWLAFKNNEGLFINPMVISLAFVYFGLFIIINYDIKSFKANRAFLTFVFSRLFVGYCLIVCGLFQLSKLFESVDIFINFTRDDGYAVVFIAGVSSLLIGIFLIFAKRIYATIFGSSLLLVFCAFMIMQAPMLILFFINKDMIMPYFENVVKSRQIIVLVVACFISGLILRGTRRFDKSKKKPLEPVSPSAKGNIIFFIFVSIVLFATVFNQYGPKNFPIYLYNIFDNTSAGFTKLANESYAYLYDRLESEEEYIKIPTLKRTEELYKKAINYYGQGKYLAALSIFQSKNNITEKDYYIDRIEQFAIGIINNANIDDYLPIKNVVLNLNDIEKKESYLTKIADTIPEYLKKAKYDVALSLVELIADTKSIDKYAPYIDIYIALSKNEFVNITEELFDEFPIDAAIKLFDDEQYLAALAIAVFNYEREKDISVELMQDIYDIISGEAKTGIYNFGGDVFSVLNKFEEFKGYFMEKEPNDSSYRATRIFLNTAYSANLHADNETEQDWFTFNLPVDGMVNIVLYTEQNYQRQLYWDLTLYKNSQIPDDKDIIAREYVPGTANETNTGDIELKKGQYYICIKSNEDWSDSEYQVIAQFLPLYVEN